MSWRRRGWTPTAAMSPCRATAMAWTCTMAAMTSLTRPSAEPHRPNASAAENGIFTCLSAPHTSVGADHGGRSRPRLQARARSVLQDGVGWLGSRAPHVPRSQQWSDRRRPRCSPRYAVRQDRIQPARQVLSGSSRGNAAQSPRSPAPVALLPYTREPAGLPAAGQPGRGA